MKLLSRAALALAFTAGTSVVLASPALAKKEKKEKAAAADAGKSKAPSFSKSFQPVIAAIDKLVKEKRFDDALTQLNDAKTKATNAYENHWVERYRMISYANKGDKAKQFEAVLAMLATGGVPAEDMGLFNFVAGSMSYDTNKYADAVKYFNEADRLGYKAQPFLISLADANYKLNNYPAGSAALEKAIAQEVAAGKKAPESWYRVSIRESSKAKLPSETAKWSRAYIRAYPTPQVWNQGLVLYRDFSRLPAQQQIDVFRLMRDSGSMAGAQDYVDYAALAMEKGMPGPGEYASVVAEGKTKGLLTDAILARIIGRPSDSVVAADKASLPLLSADAAKAVDGKKAYDAAQGWLGFGENAKAAEFYELALKKGGANFDANFANLRRGIALSRLARKAEAKTAFEAVGGSQKEVANFWLLMLELKP